MKSKGMTRLDAAHEWVREFNAIQQGIIDKLMLANIDEWEEVTAPSAGDRVYVFDLPIETEGYGTIKSYDLESDLYAIELDEGNLVSVMREGFEVERDGGLPMWGTMWSFGDSADDYWMEELGGIRIMSECGFRIYSHEEFGYFFGIDGCGYDFYEAHWLPLYNARGLQWHDEQAETEEDDEPQHNPVAEAYDTLYKVFADKYAGWDDCQIAIEEAIGYLGEALQ